MVERGGSEDDRGRSRGLLAPVRYTLTWHDAQPADWRVRRLEFVESISEPYTLRILLVTEELDADVDCLLGASCTLMVSRGAPERAMHGIARSVELLGAVENRLRVAVTIVPALALLADHQDTRFWQDKTTLGRAWSRPRHGHRGRGERRRRSPPPRATCGRNLTTPDVSTPTTASSGRGAGSRP